MSAGIRVFKVTGRDQRWQHSSRCPNIFYALRVQATTGKRAIKAFIERCEPVKGWFLGEPEDITDQLKKEEEEAGSKPQI